MTKINSSGEVNQKQQEVAQKQQEVSTNQEEVSIINTESESSNQEKITLDSESASAQSELSTTQEAVTTAQTNLSNAQTALSSAMSIPVKEIENEDGTITYDSSERDSAIAKAQSELNAAQEELEKATSENKQAQEKLDSLQDQIESIQTALEEIDTKKADAQSSLESAQSELEAAQAELQELENSEMLNEDDDSDEMSLILNDDSIDIDSIKDMTDDELEELNDKIKSILAGNTDGEISEDTLKEYAEKNNVNIDDTELLADTLNDLIKDEKYRKVVDQDSDDEISDAELEKFLDIVKEYDEDSDTLTTEDLLSAAKDIEAGTFRYATEEEIKETIGETPQADAAGTTSSAGGVGYSGGTTSNPNGITSLPTDEDKEAEINDSLDTAKNDLSEKETALSDILNGNNEEIEALKEDSENKYNSYLDALKEKDPEYAEKVNSLKTQIDEREEQLDTVEQKISDKTTSVSDLKQQYENAVLKRESLETILETLQESDSPDSETIEELEKAISAAKEEENELYAKWQAAEAELEELETEKTNLTNGTDEIVGLTDLKSQMSTLNSEIAAKYPDEIAELQEAYTSSKSKYDSEKDSAIETAEKDIQSAQNTINDLNAQKTELEIEKDVKKYTSSGELGAEVLEFASKFLNNSESQVEASCGYNLPDGLWCAAFVKYVLTQTYGDELPSWYTSCNYNSCSEVLAAAQNNGCAFTDASQAQAGDIIIFNTSRGNARHIGFVEKVENGVIYTIEGNTGNGIVGENTYQVSSSSVNSFIRIQ
ncbi:MAG: CHAP domain-containing protein [Candidatus Gastranaerophilales bacterium]|nr:CHAP domain-containing protein [Candidatus Gastranaerophilales bacterium]